jgi:hypothetical protein
MSSYYAYFYLGASLTPGFAGADTRFTTHTHIHVYSYYAYSYLGASLTPGFAGAYNNSLRPHALLA